MKETGIPLIRTVLTYIYTLQLETLCVYQISHLSVKISSSHTSTDELLTRSDFREVYEALYDISLKWLQIGMKLKINLTPVRRKYLHKGADRCLQAVIFGWLVSRKLNPSWKKLVEVLRTESVGEEALATEIEQKYVL